MLIVNLTSNEKEVKTDKNPEKKQEEKCKNEED